MHSDYVPSQESLRKKAIGLLQAILAGHDADPRLQTQAKRARVAGLYFPLIPMIMEFEPLLTPLPDPNKPSIRISGSSQVRCPRRHPVRMRVYAVCGGARTCEKQYGLYTRCLSPPPVAACSVCATHIFFYPLLWPHVHFVRRTLSFVPPVAACSPCVTRVYTRCLSPSLVAVCSLCATNFTSRTSTHQDSAAPKGYLSTVEKQGLLLVFLHILKAVDLGARSHELPLHRHWWVRGVPCLLRGL